jgi:hypothetical protein
MAMKNVTENVVIFAGRNGLDFSELRNGVLRIPEVTTRIREAQRILDGMSELNRIDLLNEIAADDETFFRNIQMKSLTAAIVQVGLFDRYLKTQRRPEFMIGNSNGDSALMVCSGQQTFSEMIRTSPALASIRAISEDRLADRVVVPFVAEPAPLLTGLSLTEYRAMAAQTSGQTVNGTFEYGPIGASAMDIKRVASALFHEEGLNRFINIGPVAAIRKSDFEKMAPEQIETLDSIDLDPMLGWFWSSVRTSSLSLAQ